MIDEARFARIKDRVSRGVFFPEDMKFLIAEVEIYVYQQQCRRQKSKQYYANNRDKILAKNHAYHKKNQSYFTESVRNWRKNNPEKDRARRQAYYLAHRDEILEKAKQRHRAKREAKMAQDDFIGCHRGYDIYARAAMNGTVFIAYKRNDINIAFRAGSLDAIKEKIDVLADRDDREREGNNGQSN